MLCWGFPVEDNGRANDYPYSNACKFTPTGGKLTITTRLMLPRPESENMEKLETPGLTLNFGSQAPHSPKPDAAGRVVSFPQDKIVVRIEVCDTGSGIRPQDMVDNKLFCACIPVPTTIVVAFADSLPQPPSTKPNRAVNKVARARVSGSPSCARSSS